MDWQPNYKIEIEIEIGMNYPCVDHLTQSKLYLSVRTEEIQQLINLT